MRRRSATGTARPRTGWRAAHGLTRATTSCSRLALPKHEPNSADGMNQACVAVEIDLLAQARHLHVDDVVERRRSPRLLPDVAGEHFPRDEMALMPEQILEQIELARRSARSADHHEPTRARDEIDLEVGGLQSKDVRRPATTQQRADAREQFRQRERLDEIVVRAEIEPEHTIVDPVACGQNQDRRFDVPFAQRLQDLEPAPAGQHQIEDDQVEQLGVRAVEPVLSRRRDDDVVVLGLQGRGQDVRQLTFVFNDQDAHQVECYRPAPASILTFVSGTHGRLRSCETASTAVQGRTQSRSDPRRRGHRPRIGAVRWRVGAEQTVVDRHQVRVVRIRFRHVARVVNLVDVRRHPDERQHPVERRPQADVGVLDDAVGRLQQPLDDDGLRRNAEQPDRHDREAGTARPFRPDAVR